MSEALKTPITIDTAIVGAPGEIATALLQVLYFPEQVFRNHQETLSKYPSSNVKLDVGLISGRFGSALRNSGENNQSAQELAIQTVIGKLANQKLGITADQITATDGGILINGHPIEVLVTDQAEKAAGENADLVFEATNVKERKTAEGLSTVGANSNNGNGPRFIELTSPAKSEGIHPSMAHVTGPDIEGMINEMPYLRELLSCSTHGTAQIINAFIQAKLGNLRDVVIALPHAATPSDDPELIADNGYPHKTGAAQSLKKLFGEEIGFTPLPWRVGNIPASGSSLVFMYDEPIAANEEQAKRKVYELLDEYEAHHPGTFNIVTSLAKEDMQLAKASRVPHAATLYPENMKFYQDFTRVVIDGAYDNVYGYTQQILQTVHRDLSALPPQVLTEMLTQLKTD